MSGTPLSVERADFLTYWEAEGAAYARQGDYAWMAAQVPGRRVLEIGCGLGFGTQALLDRGLEVLALELLEPCLEAARARLGEHPGLRFLQVDLATLDDAVHQELSRYAPDTVVCWLMGAPQDIVQGQGAGSREAQAAVVSYREAMHRQVAILAASLPSVSAVHLVDRSVIPWQAKDLGRDTLAQYHQFKTFDRLPFTASRADALYRKLQGQIAAPELASLRLSHAALKSVTPVLASLLVRRRIS